MAQPSYSSSASQPGTTNVTIAHVAKTRVDSDSLQAYVGEYELGPGQRLTVSLADGKLYILPPGETTKAELKATNASEFVVIGEEARLVFKTNQAGKVSQLEIRFGNGAAAIGKKV